MSLVGRPRIELNKGVTHRKQEEEQMGHWMPVQCIIWNAQRIQGGETVHDRITKKENRRKKTLALKNQPQKNGIGSAHPEGNGF